MPPLIMHTRQWQRALYSNKQTNRVLPADCCDESVGIQARQQDDTLQRQIETLSQMLAQQDERLKQQETVTARLMRHCVQSPRLAWATEQNTLPIVRNEYPANFHQGTTHPLYAL